MPDKAHLEPGHRLFPLHVRGIAPDHLDDVLDRNVSLFAPLPRKEYVRRLHVLVFRNDVSDMALGAHQAPGFLARELVGFLADVFQGFSQCPPGNLEPHGPVFVAVDAGGSKLPEFLGYFCLDLKVGVREIRLAHLLLQLARKRGLAGQAGPACLQPRGVDFELIDDHVVMAAGFVILHAETPSVEEQWHVGEFAQLVVVGVLCVIIVFVFRFTHRPRVFRFCPGIVFQGIGFSPVCRVEVAVRNGRRFYRLSFLRRAAGQCESSRGQACCQYKKKEPFPIHYVSPLRVHLLMHSLQNGGL